LGDDDGALEGGTSVALSSDLAGSKLGEKEEKEEISG